MNPPLQVTRPPAIEVQKETKKPSEEGLKNGEQKTAYAMSVSDWSSDVCSSDLALVRMASGAPRSEIKEERSGGQDRKSVV